MVEVSNKITSGKCNKPKNYFCKFETHSENLFYYSIGT